ncbi:hypothetical protein JCM10049v2_005867 [Rhodotorula toruloides]
MARQAAGPETRAVVLDQDLYTVLHPSFDASLAPLFDPTVPALANPDQYLAALRQTCVALEPDSLVERFTNNAEHHVAGMVSANDLREAHARSLLLFDTVAKESSHPTSKTRRGDESETGGDRLDPAWRAKAKEDEEELLALVNRIDAAPSNGCAWSPSISRARAILSLLASVCNLGYLDKPLLPRPLHDVVKSRLSEATALARGNKGSWGRGRLNKVLPGLRTKFKAQDAQLLSLAGGQQPTSDDDAAAPAKATAKKPKAEKPRPPPRGSDSLRWRDESTSLAGMCAPKTRRRRATQAAPLAPSPPGSALVGDADGIEGAASAATGDQDEDEEAEMSSPRAVEAEQLSRRRSKGKGKMEEIEEGEQETHGDKGAPDTDHHSTSDDSLVTNDHHPTSDDPLVTTRSTSVLDDSHLTIHRDERVEYLEQQVSKLTRETTSLDDQLAVATASSENYRRKYQMYKRAAVSLGGQVSSDGSADEQEEEQGSSASQAPATRQPLVSTKQKRGSGASPSARKRIKVYSMSCDADEADSEPAKSVDGKSGKSVVGKGGATPKVVPLALNRTVVNSPTRPTLRQTSRTAPRSPRRLPSSATKPAKANGAFKAPAQLEHRKTPQRPPPPRASDAPLPPGFAFGGGLPPALASAFDPSTLSPQLARLSVFASSTSHLNFVVTEKLLEVFSEGDFCVGLEGMYEREDEEGDEKDVAFDGYDWDAEDEERSRRWTVGDCRDAMRSFVENWDGFGENEVLNAKGKTLTVDGEEVARREIERALQRLRDEAEEGEEEKQVYWRRSEGFILSMWADDCLRVDRNLRK